MREVVRTDTLGRVMSKVSRGQKLTKREREILSAAIDASKKAASEGSGGSRTVTLRVLKRPPARIKRISRGRKVLVGEFTVNVSEATKFAKVAGKRKRWYLLRDGGHAFELYDKRGRYYGTFTKTELFGDRKLVIER